jgi:hypothetical protein
MKQLLPIVSLVLLSFAAACGGGSDEQTEAKTSVGRGTAAGLTVELFSDGKLATGMEPIFIAVTSGAGEPVTDAAVDLSAKMAMDDMEHGAPVVGTPAIGDGGQYACDVVFPMASSAMASWTATVGVARPGAARAEVTVGPLAVEDSGRAAAFMDGETRYVASLNFTADPKVGLNPVVVTLHASQDMMMTFAAVTDASLSMDPQMPAMGHGAPDSVQPKATTLGRYDGQLSFTMTGTWETTVTVSRGGKVVGTPRFTTTF